MSDLTTPRDAAVADDAVDPNDIDWVAQASAHPRTLRGTNSRLPHVAWALLGIATVPAAWYAWSLPGGIALFAAIVAAFVLWHLCGSRGAWMALIVIGVGMSGLLGWQAATGSRCPADGTRVFLKVDKPSVDCAEIRASAATMSAFFGLVALLGVGAPIYARRVD
jgi:hypothetical protein